MKLRKPANSRLRGAPDESIERIKALKEIFKQGDESALKDYAIQHEMDPDSKEFADLLRLFHKERAVAEAKRARDKERAKWRF